MGIAINELNVSGNNVVVENLHGNLIIDQNSSTDDVLKIFNAIQQKVEVLDIAEKDKMNINNQLENAKKELYKEAPNKKSIEESIRKTNEILKETKTTAETLKDIGVLIGKSAKWLGTTAAALGWIF